MVPKEGSESSKAPAAEHGRDPRQHIPAFMRRTRVADGVCYRFDYRMHGRFRFPLGCLRLDCAFPATEDAVMEIERQLRHFSPAQDLGEVVGVALVAFAHEPSWVPSQTWHAHGWTLDPTGPPPLEEPAAT